MQTTSIAAIFLVAAAHFARGQYGYAPPFGQAAPSGQYIVTSGAVQSNSIIVSNNPYEQHEEIKPTPASTPPPTTVTPRVNCHVSDILFVLDATGSVREFYEAQKKYILDIVEQLDISPRAQHVGIIQYASKRRQKIYVDLDEAPEKSDFVKKVSALPYYNGVTATGSALELAEKALQKRRPGLESAVIVLTDGFSYDRVERPAQVLNELPANTVYVAGIASPFAQSELNLIAGDPSRVLLGVEKKAELLAKLKC